MMHLRDGTERGWRRAQLCGGARQSSAGDARHQAPFYTRGWRRPFGSTICDRPCAFGAQSCALRQPARSDVRGEVLMRLCMLRFLGIVLAVDLASGGVGPENFRGAVRDAAGGGLPGASVLVQRWDWDRSTKRPRLVSTPPVQTDDEGRFSIYSPPGSMMSLFLTSRWSRSP